jgi:hypothetical protein
MGGTSREMPKQVLRTEMNECLQRKIQAFDHRCYNKGAPCTQKDSKQATKNAAQREREMKQDRITNCNKFVGCPTDAS